MHTVHQKVNDANEKVLLVDKCMDICVCVFDGVIIQKLRAFRIFLFSFS